MFKKTWIKNAYKFVPTNALYNNKQIFEIWKLTENDWIFQMKIAVNGTRKEIEEYYFYK